MPSHLHRAPNAGLPTPALADVASMGPDAWVIDELRQCLLEAQAALRRGERPQMGQRLHAAAEALERLERVAEARTVRALQVALERQLATPTLAPEALADAVSAGGPVLLDALAHGLCQRPVSPQALFPAYQAWQQLAGAARIHPADLWLCAPRTVPVPAGPALSPEPALRTQLERLVLALLKGRDATAAAALVPLAAGLARGAAAPEVAQYWLAVAACFEALAGGGLPDDIYVKRAVTSVLTQYTAWVQGRDEGWPRHTHDLLYQIAHLPPEAIRPDSPHDHAIRQTYGWLPQSPAPLPAEPQPEAAWVPPVPPPEPSGPSGPATTVPPAHPDPARVPVLRDALQIPPVLDQPVKEVGPLRIELERFNAFLADADDESRQLLQRLEAPEQAADPAPLRLAGALACGAAAVGHEGLVQLARGLELALERLHQTGEPTHTQPAVQAVLIEAAQQLQGLLHQFAAGIWRNPLPETLSALAAVAPLPSPAVGTLSVRTDWLERLAVQVADLGQSRARIESDWAAMCASITEVAALTDRLRSQCHALELQTEPHLPAAAPSGGAEVQPLRRQMAQTLDDLAAVQHQLQQAAKAAEGGLAEQARLARELQRDVLRSQLGAIDAVAGRVGHD